QYGVNALPIKRGAREGGVDQLVAHLRGRLVGNRERSELLAMGGQFLGKIGEAEDQRAGGRGVDAAAGDVLRLVADGRRGGRPAAPGEGLGGCALRLFGPAELVEAVEP